MEMLVVSRPVNGSMEEADVMQRGSLVRRSTTENAPSPLELLVSERLCIMFAAGREIKSRRSCNITMVSPCILHGRVASARLT